MSDDKKLGDNQHGTNMKPNHSSSIRYAHTNLVARNWEAMRDFYVDLFDCEPVGSVRDRAGTVVEQLTGIEGIAVVGQHLRLPGYEEGGPTLEIFQFTPTDEIPLPVLNNPGFTHLAFEVPDVEEKRQQILLRGGDDVGERVTLDIEGAGKLTLMYVTDPEGNIIELQHWDTPN
ncbi:hypothetical protein MNBD_PLANCTO02-1695 [hydrothermal vent metagenome]|uniref:VOC domain-containing protein n=1 Tax=hydrothermal vent metagenome TaxID=652676 RepID=A0A3B1E5Y1_9ZZZZ